MFTLLPIFDRMCIRNDPIQDAPENDQSAASALSSARMNPPQLLTAAAAVGIGAAAGALLRWQLSIWLNPMHESVAPGTLVANVVGGYLVGLAMAWFAQQPDLTPEEVPIPAPARATTPLPSPHPASRIKSSAPVGRPCRPIQARA